MKLWTGLIETNLTIGGNVTNYSVIDKEGKVTHYVWCNPTRRMVVQRAMTETVVIYSNGGQECERLSSLLKTLGGEFLEYKLGQHFTQRSFETEFGKGAEYPQINIGFRHVGGLKETLQYMKERGAFV